MSPGERTWDPLDLAVVTGAAITERSARQMLLTRGRTILMAAAEAWDDDSLGAEFLRRSPPARPGYLPIVLHDGGKVRLRVNAWEPPYIRFLESLPTVHGHNWEMVSMVVGGQLQNTWFAATPSAAGAYQDFLEVGGVGTGRRKALGDCNCEVLRRSTVMPGEIYHVARAELHAVVPIAPLTFTLCLQYDVQPADRRLCLRRGVEVGSYFSTAPTTLDDLRRIGGHVRNAVRTD